MPLPGARALERVALTWKRLLPRNADANFVPGPRDLMTIGRTSPLNSMFLWGGEDNAITFQTAWEFVFHARVHLMRHLDAVATHRSSAAAPPGRTKLSPAHADGRRCHGPTKMPRVGR